MYNYTKTICRNNIHKLLTKIPSKFFAIKEKFQLISRKSSERFDVPVRILFRWQPQLEPITKKNKFEIKIDIEKLAKQVKKFFHKFFDI